MQKWEYVSVQGHLTGNRVVTGGTDAADLNALGDQGWELVAVEPARTDDSGVYPPIFWLKRPVGDER